MTEEVTITDKNVESASQEFSKVTDATATFLKSVFPHAHKFITKLRGKPESKD